MTERKEGLAWTVDADVTLQSLLDDPECPELLCRALSGIHSWQGRNETTVRRALKASRLAPQWLAALLALGAVVTVEEAVEAEVPLEDLLENKISDQIAALHIPRRGSHTCWGEARVGRTPADEPIVAAFATVEANDGVVEEARVALTGVWSQPARLTHAPAALVGEPLSRERIQVVAAAVEDEVEPQGDYLGSTAYRRAMAGVLTRRALEACAAARMAGGER